MVVVRNILLLLLTPLAHLSNAASSSSKPSTSATNFLTCPSRTVNYITHGLPQQCLASSRLATINGTSPASPQVSNVTSTTIWDSSKDGVQTKNLGSTSAGTSTHANAMSASVWPLPVTLDSPPEPETKTLPDDLGHSSSPMTATPAVSSATIDVSEPDLLLGNSNFLSFEDWKKQNLLKAGQSEHVGASRHNEHRHTEKRANPALQQGLDALGDDAEIDLDFTGFVADRPDLAAPKQAAKAALEDNGLETEQEPAISKIPRGKDAGTTCKERYNYASFDCAATVLKTNKQAKGEKFVLLENKDSYMLNECSAPNKFLILELCTDISIDTIVLANFEFFSSIFRTFRVSVSDKYPVKTDEWVTLGTFEARNTREIQAFLIENPMIWARYIRFEFLTHYGNEFYCPLSLVRVHGTTQMEEYKYDVASAMLDKDGDGVHNTEDSEPEETLIPEAIAQVLVEEKSRSEEAERAVQTRDISEEVMISVSSNHGLPELEHVMTIESVHNTTSPNRRAEDIFVSSNKVCSMTEASLVEASLPPTANNTKPFLVAERVSGTQKPDSVLVSSTKLNSTTPTSSNATKVTDSSKKTASHNVVDKATNISGTNTTYDSGKASNATASEKSKSSSSSTQPQPASPTIQESFFKSVQKRLQMLESNSSLSLQYIEEQSRALRDAFGRVEQKQLSKTTTFLDYLNTTVLNELRDFRQQYDQLWQSTVIELETQREQYQQETLAINSRLAILTDELIFQKRMSILQMVLILVCFGLVLFSRGPMNNYMDMPIVQGMLTRSPSNRWMNVAGLHTPSNSPPQTRPSSSHHAKPVTGVLKKHSRERSDDSMNSAVHHTEEYSPLTPISNDDQYDEEHSTENLQSESLTYDPSEIERPSTSPPVLPSSESAANPDFIALRDETIDSRILRAPRTDLTDGNPELPEFTLRPATPPVKHLTFKLPE